MPRLAPPWPGLHAAAMPRSAAAARLDGCRASAVRSSSAARRTVSVEACTASTLLTMHGVWAPGMADDIGVALPAPSPFKGALLAPACQPSHPFKSLLALVDVVSGPTRWPSRMSMLNSSSLAGRGTSAVAAGKGRPSIAAARMSSALRSWPPLAGAASSASSGVGYRPKTSATAPMPSAGPGGGGSGRRAGVAGASAISMRSRLAAVCRSNSGASSELRRASSSRRTTGLSRLAAGQPSWAISLLPRKLPARAVTVAAAPAK
eukprot:scaffold7204_cov102-Isochrysis_galbana.AAC.3